MITLTLFLWFVTVIGIHIISWRVYVCIKVKKAGGLTFNSTLPLTKCSEKMVQMILHEYSILKFHSYTPCSVYVNVKWCFFILPRQCNTFRNASRQFIILLFHFRDYFENLELSLLLVMNVFASCSLCWCLGVIIWSSFSVCPSLFVTSDSYLFCWASSMSFLL